MVPLPLFVYGTLTDPRVREQVLGRRSDLEVVRARLPGHARVTVPDFAYPFVVPSADDVVDRQLILGLTVADYAVLDEYEDVAAGTYERIAVEVEPLGCGTARAARAWVYAYPSRESRVASREPQDPSRNDS